MPFLLSVHQTLPPLSSDSSHPSAAYCSFIDPRGMKGWVGLVSWLLTYAADPYKWLPISCRSGAGQGRFAGQRPTFYHCTRQLELFSTSSCTCLCTRSSCVLHTLQTCWRRSLKPGFHPNAIACVACVWMETGLNASACVGKQPIMVATASTEHPIGCCACNARNARNAIDCVWMETGLHVSRLCDHPSTATSSYQERIGRSVAKISLF